MTNENIFMMSDGESDSSLDQSDDPRSAVSADKIEAILGATDDELGRYLISGEVIHGAIEEALRNARALTEVLTCLDGSDTFKRVPMEHWSHIAWMASGMIQRAQELYSLQSSCDRSE